MAQLRRQLDVPRKKRSLLARLRPKRLDAPPGEGGVEVSCVSFNAWTAEGEDVLEGLVKSVLDAMDPNVLRRALRRRRLIGVLKVPVLVIAGWLRVGALANEAWEKLSVDASTRNQVNDLVRQAMADWAAKTARTPGVGSDRILVVFIDDLDRCSPENVMKVFEGLKLYLDARGFVFVIGYDEAILTEAVADRKQYSSEATGRDYVEKIIQIVIRIPQPSKEEVDALVDRLLAHSGTTPHFDDAGRKLLIERNDRNPRKIKRFLNRFILDYKLDSFSHEMKPELHIKLLIFETYFPEFARLFVSAAETNPIREFLDFVSVRDGLRRGKQVDLTDDVFERYRIAPGADTGASLKLLEGEVPEAFVRLAQDGAFLSLVRGIDDADDQQLIVGKVQRSIQKRTRIVSAEVAGRKHVLRSLEFERLIPLLPGSRILWIDDHPENNAALGELFTSAGAELQLATGGDAALELLPSFIPDLVISDVGRDGRPTAGFEDVGGFRAGLYAGPVVFYTARITRSGRAAAEELGASIVSQEAQLFDAMANALEPQLDRSSRVPVPA